MKDLNTPELIEKASAKCGYYRKAVYNAWNPWYELERNKSPDEPFRYRKHDNCLRTKKRWKYITAHRAIQLTINWQLREFTDITLKKRNQRIKEQLPEVSPQTSLMRWLKT